ncbi:MAG: AbrB family transcriptional regulator [Gloeotrichia echinulata IR180]
MKKLGVETEAFEEIDDLLMSKKYFLVTKLDDVAGCLKFKEKLKTLEDMDNSIRQGVEESWHDCG